MDRYLQLRARAVSFVREFAPAGPVLILGPERAAAEEVARIACDRALLGVTRLGFRDLPAAIASGEMNRRGLVPVGRVVREALAARVAASADLTYLHPVAGFPGFPRALTETFEELRLNGVRPEDLRRCGQSGPDLADLLSAYERELEDRRFADHALRVQLAMTEARLTDTAVVVLDVAPRTKLERELLGSVLRWARVALDLRLEGSGEEGLPEGSVEIFSTSGEALECVEIARRIGQSGVPYDETAILLRSPERHQPLVIEAMRRAGIPAHCTHGASRPDAAGRSFLALLYCAEEGLSASRFAEYLSLGPSPALWERLLVDAAVIGGAERWRTRLKGLRAELEQKYRDEPKEWIDRWVTSLDSLAETAMPVIERLEALPRQATWGEWIAALEQLATSTLEDTETVLTLLEDLRPMSEIGPVGLGEVLRVLSPRLGTLRTAPKEARYGKVWVGGIEEARGMAFRQAFVPGVNEGLFPRPPAEDPLLWQSQREALGIELRPDDSELLRIAVACASEKLSLSFSRLDLLTGRERVPSFYAFAMHRRGGGANLDVRQFEERARAETETKIGWPAPNDPADAIDEAEFDLATLAPRAPGSGQYLKRMQGLQLRAVEALRSRWARWHRPWKAADGLFVEEIGSDALKPYLLTERAWSTSALQQYARCPYRFALHGIFGLRPAERPGAIQRLDPATRGEIYHEAQYRLMESGQRDLDAVLDGVAAKWKEKLAPAIPQVWESEMQSLRADLHGWLERRSEEWEPLAAEMEFDTAIEGGARLKGRVDLVERHGNGALRVVDYKTGKPPEPRPEMVGGGETLQPALYAMAVETVRGEPVECGRLYYATVAQNYAAIDIPMNEWTRRRAAQVLATIDGAMRDGFLPAAPRKDGCKRCDYLPVCGPYEEERVALKSQVELGRLKELRSWR